MLAYQRVTTSRTFGIENRYLRFRSGIISLIWRLDFVWELKWSIIGTMLPIQRGYWKLFCFFMYFFFPSYSSYNLIVIRWNKFKFVLFRSFNRDWMSIWFLNTIFCLNSALKIFNVQKSICYAYCVNSHITLELLKDDCVIFEKILVQLN